MARAIAGLVMVLTLAGAIVATGPVEARGSHRGGFSGHRGHPINAWMGSRRLRLR